MANDNKAAKKKNLFDEFPPVSREEWEKVIVRDLNGAEYKETLKWETGEGIDVLPFYRREDLERVEHTGTIPAGRRKKNDWEIRQPVFDRDVAEANRSIHSALERGADSLQLKLRIHKTDGMLGGDIEGTAIQGQNDFSTLLAGVQPDHTAIHFDASMASPALMAMLHNLANERGLDREKIGSTFLYDPYVYTIISGQLPKPEQVFLNEARQMAGFCDTHLPSVRCLGVDARAYHNSGATVVQELALALATGSEYLARLSDLGLSARKIIPRIHFSFAVGSSYFPEIAKFRAFRLLWPKVAEAYMTGTHDPVNAYIHGETSEWNKTIYDPHTNLLRTTTEGMSAAIAGCDAVTVNPFDLTFRQPNDSANRLARNAQIIFKEEAWLDQVYDPGAGSYYIETVTDKIAGRSWELFQEIEQQGGMMKAITNRTVASLIEQSVRDRNRAVAYRNRVFIGSNQYPDTGSRMGERIDRNFKVTSLRESDDEFTIDRVNITESLAGAFKSGAKLGDVVPALFDPGKQLFRPIQPYRGVEAFEELRLATERHEPVPTVFLLPMGNRKLRKARSTFAANLLGCAGYEIMDHIGFDTVDGAIAEVKEVMPDIVVICSSDKEYKELVEPICTRLRELDPKPLIVLAGYPEEELTRYQKAGVNMFIHTKANALETLREFHQKLNIIKN